ncbi:MAG: DHH family phosphoesterase, partial [Paraclostridium sp.]
MYNIKQRKVNEINAKKIASKYNLSIEVVSLLLGRGYEEEFIELLTATEIGLLNPHNSIKNVEEASYEIAEYIQNDNAKIYIYADYDSDGINAGFIMGDCIKQLIKAMNSKCELEVCLPNRTAGYGLNMQWCEWVNNDAKEFKKDALVITVDNGITKKDETEYLVNHDINVIITDHHVPKEGLVPECLVVDPWLNDLDSKDSLGLCGAAVAYKICAYLLEEIYKDTTGYHLLYVPHVAIATITDMMPVTKENIAFVKYGLHLIDNEYCTDGVLHYKQFAGKNITPKDIAFELGPQLNACGRMGKTEVAGALFFGDDEVEIDEIYNEIFKINDNRKAKEKEIVEEIFSRDLDLENKILIIEVEELGGLGGTVASKVVEKYQRPVILITGNDNMLHGSARAIGNVDLHELFANEVKNGNMLDFGGHKAAAGVYIMKNKIKALQTSLNRQLDNIEIISEDEERD